MKNLTKVFSDGNIAHRIYHSRSRNDKSGKIFTVIEKPNRLCFESFSYRVGPKENNKTDFNPQKERFGCISYRNSKYYQYKFINPKRPADKRLIKACLKLPDKIEFISKIPISKYQQRENKASKERIIKVLNNFTNNKFKEYIKPDFTIQRSLQFLTYPILFELYNQVSVNRQQFILNGFNSFISCHARTNDFKEFVHNCFGYSNNKLVKECAQTIKEVGNLDLFTFGSLYRTTVPVDYYYKFAQLIRNIRSSSILFPLNTSNKDVKKFIRLFSIKRMMNFYSEINHNGTDRYWLFRDTLNGWVKAEDKTIRDGWNTLERIHDNFGNREARLAMLRNEEAEKEDFELTENIEYFKDLDGVTINTAMFPNLTKNTSEMHHEFKFVVPKTRQELLKWGNSTEKSLMYNCIGRMYSCSCRDGYTKILGIEKNGKLTYNISIKNNKQVEQFLGYKNSQPDANDKKLIVDYLTDKGYIIGDMHEQFNIEFQGNWNNIEARTGRLEEVIF